MAEPPGLQINPEDGLILTVDKALTVTTTLDTHEAPQASFTVHVKVYVPAGKFAVIEAEFGYTVAEPSLHE